MENCTGELEFSVMIYCKTSDRSRVPHKRWVPDTGRGSRQFVLIEAGSRLQARSQIQAGGNHVLLTMEMHHLYSDKILKIITMIDICKTIFHCRLNPCQCLICDAVNRNIATQTISLQHLPH